MNVHYMFSFIAVLVLLLISAVGAGALGLESLFGIIIPYLAIAVFVLGFIYRIAKWAKSPVPFRIPTTCGQQKTIPGFKPAKIDNPTTQGAVFLRMLLEIVLFRSLFRNTRMKLKEGKISYNMELFLWIGALAFHYAFAVTLVRHLRLFTEPVPMAVQLLERLDAFFRVEIMYDVARVGLPGVYLSGIVLLAAVTYLFLRRVTIPHLRYISLSNDFFPLILIFGIAFSGILMRYFTKINVVAAKELAVGLISFHPHIPADPVGTIFYVHLFFVSVLLIYFPFSKLMHLGGIFMSPTRNMTTDTRERRHINPWNYPVPVHTYEEYEDEFREKMVEAGLPVDKMPEPQPSDDEPVSDEKE